MASRTRIWLNTASLIGAAVSGVAFAAPSNTASPNAVAASPATVAGTQVVMRYPETRRTDLAETQFGTRVADPYRWLEDDVRKSAEVAAWVKAQNDVTNAYLATLPARSPFVKRMTELYNYERFSSPIKRGDRYFFMRNDGLQKQSVLFVRDGLNGTNRTLIDPNTWAADGATALAEWVPSDDGSKLLYTVQDGGTDWRIVRVMDATTGTQFSDELRWVKFSNFAWAKDGSGFYYSRFPEAQSGTDFQSLNTNQAVYFHRLGTPQAQDQLIYATPDHPRRGHGAQLTDDGRYLVVTTSEGTDDRYEVTVIDLKARVRRPVKLFEGLNHSWGLVANRGSKFIFETNKDAPRGRLVEVDLRRPSQLREFVAQNDGTLTGASQIGNRIILSYLTDARSLIRVIDMNGRPVKELELAGVGTAAGFSGSSKDPITFFSFSSFATPSTVYRFDTRTGETSIFAQPKLTFNPADFDVKQVFYPSKDGTRVPMFLISKKGASRPGGSPTLLYGYGGFNASMTPSFSPTRLAWVDAGGVLAIANLRGGGEYGKAWHDAGRLLNKQNVFDDFIAAGEYLIREGVTGKDQLAIEGRSNGGLLVGAVVNQRPDLFAAALPAVGVMDMLRFDRFTAGRYWVDDYGRPDQEADFRNLLRYSPYHNIRTGVRYPAILVTTADTDDRVVPGHSFKYTAALQAADIGDRPHLIRIETRAGHGSGKPTDKIIAETADMYAFIARWTGLDVQ